MEVDVEDTVVTSVYRQVDTRGAKEGEVTESHQYHSALRVRSYARGEPT